MKRGARPSFQTAMPMMSGSISLVWFGATMNAPRSGSFPLISHRMIGQLNGKATAARNQKIEGRPFSGERRFSADPRFSADTPTPQP